jgi:hypothetical protein
VSSPDALLIRNDCEFLKKIVKGSSLDFSAETALLDDIDAIAQIAEEQPGNAEYRLKSMARRLKETPNGKGEPILSGEQHAKLFGSRDRI